MRCASDSVETLASVLADAQVGLNPHRVEAALFAFCSGSLTDVLEMLDADRDGSAVDDLLDMAREYF